MAEVAELFTECSSCGNQVSKFQTECPYCGNRLRERAPSLQRLGGELDSLNERLLAPAEEPKRKSSKKSTPRRKPKLKVAGGSKGKSKTRFSLLAPSLGRPWGSIFLGVLTMLGMLAVTLAGQGELLFGGKSGTDPWRLLTAPFAYLNGWHQFTVFAAIAVFGWLWERRAGPLVPLILFAVGSIGGVYVASVLSPDELLFGGSGGALALVVAWIVAELRARQKKTDLDGDLLGACVFALVVVGVALVVPLASAVPLAVGAVAGALAGLGLFAADR